MAALFLTACGAAGCTDNGDDEPSGAPPSRPRPTPTFGNLPPIGINLQALLADPDPDTQSAFTGPLTMDRITKEELLPEIDIDCLKANGFTLGYAKDGTGQPTAVTWVFELGSPESAVNCGEQMRRTDGFAGPVTDRSGTYDISGVTAYSVAAQSDGRPLAIWRAIYTDNNRLFRVTVSQVGSTPEQLEPRFATLLSDQVDQSRSGS